MVRSNKAGRDNVRQKFLEAKPMTSKLSKAKQRAITERFNAGDSDQEIARKVGVSRQTVAKYTFNLDEGLVIKDTPAAQLTASQVAFAGKFDFAAFSALKEGIIKLARAHEVVQCPVCKAKLTVLRTQRRVHCWHCPEPGNKIDYVSESATAWGDACDWRTALDVLMEPGSTVSG